MVYSLLRCCGWNSPYHEEPLQCLGMLQTGTGRSRWAGWRDVTTASGCLRCHLCLPPSLNAPLLELPTPPAAPPVQHSAAYATCKINNTYFIITNTNSIILLFL